MSDSPAEDDVLDLFPEEGDMFSLMELDKKATPKKNPQNIQHSYAPSMMRITPIEFDSPDNQGEMNARVSNKLGEAITINKRKVTSRLGKYF